MSITQDRLRRLIEAAADYEQGARAIIDRAQALADLDPSPGLKNLAETSFASFMRDPIGSAQTIALESERLRLTWHKNQRRNATRLGRKADHADADLDAEYAQWKEASE